MSRPALSAVDRKSELLIIARRSRIRWVKSADDSKSDSLSVKRKPIAEKVKAALPTVSTDKASSSDTFQRTFDFLTDIIADGETVDVNSLIRKVDINDDDDLNYDETRQETVNDLSSRISVLREMALDNYTFTVFLEALCSRNSVGIVKSMQQFVSQFESRVRTRMMSLDEKQNQEDSLRGAESIWAYLEHLANEMQDSEGSLWKGEVEERQVVTRSYCEKFVFSKLYSATFHSSYEDYFLNEKLGERILSLSFLRPEHLDIKTLYATSKGCNKESSPKQNTTSTATGFGTASSESKWWLEYIEEAVTSLQDLQHAVCPEGKIHCIKRLSSAVEKALMKNNNNVESGSRSSGGGVTTLGADDVLPLLILCVKESNPPSLFSELKYLQIYMNPSQAYGEEGYLLTQLASAVNFLESVDATALTISTDEFSKSLRRCKERHFVSLSPNTSDDRVVAVEGGSDCGGIGTEGAALQGRVGRGWNGLPAVHASNGCLSYPHYSSHVSTTSNGNAAGVREARSNGDLTDKPFSLFELYLNRTKKG